MEPITFDPSGWGDFAGRLLEMAPYAGLTLIAGLSIGWLLDRVLSRNGSTRDVQLPEPPATIEPPVLQRPAPPIERVLLAVGTRGGTVAKDSPLYGAGLSPVDVIALTSLREHVASGDVAEDPNLAQRVAFARWLAEHERLTD